MQAIQAQDHAALLCFGIHGAIWQEVQEALRPLGDEAGRPPLLSLPPLPAQAPHPAPGRQAFDVYDMHPVDGQRRFGVDALLWINGAPSDWTLRAELRPEASGWALHYRLIEVM